MRNLYVSDITLRVLDEALETSLSFRERLTIASRMEKSGVNTIELPVLTGSKENAVIFRTIAEAVECGVAVPVGFTEEGVTAAWNTVRSATHPILQVILPVSTVQMEYLYHLKAPKMLEKIAQLCSAAAAVCPDVEFIARDATRAEAGFTAQCCQTAVQNGAKFVTVCDDDGCCFPDELAQLVTEVCAACQADVFVQPSNALSMAASCCVEALKAGASGVKTSGKGNYLRADTMADILRAKGPALELTSHLDDTAIHNIFENLFAADSVPVKTSDTPAVGQDTLTLDAGCTISEVSAAVGSLGYELSDEDLGKVYDDFKRTAQKKSAIGARELEAIIAASAMQVPSTFHLVSYVVTSGNITSAMANVTLERDGERISGVSTGDGPIDAAFFAIEQIIGHHYELDDFQIQSITKGREALGSSLIRLRAGGKLYSGNGLSTDIVGAAIRAYINALNKIVYEGR